MDATSSKEPTVVEDAKPNITGLNFFEGAEKDTEFVFPVGHVYLRVNTCVFHIHRYKLAEFRMIKPKLVHDMIVLPGNEVDFRNTLKILHASWYSASLPAFDTSVWISTLRIATNFDHPLLRGLAIHRLDLKALPPLQYLPFAREFNVPAWETKALDYLVARDEPISVAEAEMLGTGPFVEVVMRREQRLVGQNAAAQGPAGDGFAGLPAKRRLVESDDESELGDSAVVLSDSSAGPGR